MPRGRARAVGALVAVGLVALLMLVALGTRADQRTRPGDEVEREVPVGLLDFALTISVIVGLAAVVLAVMLVPRPGVRRRPDRGRLYLSAVLVLAAIAAAGALVANLPQRDRLRDALGGVVSQGRERSERERETQRTRRSPRVRWEVILAGGAVATVALAAYARSRRRLPGTATSLEAELADELVLVMSDAIDDLRAERDARRAVVAAYARMEAALASHGFPRRPFETPLEYLARILRDLHVRPEALLALTELFERAKFSPHEIDAEMKEEAILAFAAGRDELGSAELGSAELGSAELGSAGRGRAARGNESE